MKTKNTKHRQFPPSLFPPTGKIIMVTKVTIIIITAIKTILIKKQNKNNNFSIPFKLSKRKEKRCTKMGNSRDFGLQNTSRTENSIKVPYQLSSFIIIQSFTTHKDKVYWLSYYKNQYTKIIIEKKITQSYTFSLHHPIILTHTQSIIYHLPTHHTSNQTAVQKTSNFKFP